MPEMETNQTCNNNDFIKYCEKESKYGFSSSKLTEISDQDRHIFFGFFLLVIILSLIGNVAAIISISKRKFRFFQKSCIISLAVADIFSTFIIGLNNLEKVSHPQTNWTLGEFFCKFVPMGQMAGVISTAFSLMFIALDRYRNIVNALNTTLNPKPLLSITIFLFVGIISFLLSIPMVYFFDHMPLTIYYEYKNKNATITCYTKDTYICVTFSKNNLRLYYYAIMGVIFIPLAIIFLWFYYKIAVLVWKHRKPVNRTQTQIDPSEKVRVERKIRTFKIIIMLILVFTFLRLPYFIVWTIKLSLPNTSSGLWLFYLGYITSGAHILNCALNPLLYTFLNPTIALVKKVFWDICCCFCSNEFDEYEQKKDGDNPFVVEGQRDSRVKFEEEVQEYQNNAVYTKPLKKY